MEILIFLIAISVTVATGFLISFIWAVRNGQFEDEYTPAMRMLFDEKVKSSEFRVQSLELENTQNSTLNTQNSTLK